MSMTQAEINADLFDQVKRLQIENRDLKGDCERERDEADELREQNAKLRDIAERAIDAVFNKLTEDILRAELDKLKEGAK